jgi:anti-anti-sigma factor
VGAFEARVDADCVVWLSGDLDLAVTARFAVAAAGALEAHRALLIDLSELEFIDSSGVRTILETARRTDRGVVLRRPRPNVRKVIDITGIVGRYGIRVEE